MHLFVRVKMDLLVERALEIIRLLGGRNLGPEETRQRLDLEHAG